MSNAEIRGRFIWHELMTPEPDAAAAFYSKVLPWKSQPSGMPSYSLWMAGKVQAGGLASQADDARQSGAPPSWLVYIGTPDVDSTAVAAERLGGKILKGATDIPGIGRFAVLTDPRGAAFAVFSPAAPAPAGASASGGAGHFSWHELATTDPEAALGFYCELFGWARGPGHDMGGMGTYHIIEHGGRQVGGMYALRDASTPPHWLSYVQVESADRAAAAARDGGGRVLNGPMEVPGGSRVAQILDPQGGAFAVHEQARSPSRAQAPKPARAPRREAQPAARAPRQEAEPAARPAAPARTRPAKKAARRKAAAGKATRAHGRSKITTRAGTQRRGGRSGSPARKGASAAGKRRPPARRGKPVKAKQAAGRRSAPRKAKSRSRSGRRR
jgi:predicted enzyme related to lactoylglutathione lyase